MTSILRQSGTTLFATSLVLVANIARREIAFANAGHPHPIHIRRLLGIAEPLASRSGPALGIFPGAEYVSCRVPLASGDLVLLFTDGLFEVENARGELYSYEHLLAAAARRQHLPGQALCEELIEEVRHFAGIHEFPDDVCLLGMEIAGPVTSATRAPERDVVAEVEVGK
jgi:serine phosphatase RsbU (regulator of sigma subunit)